MFFVLYEFKPYTKHFFVCLEGFRIMNILLGQDVCDLTKQTMIR